MQKAENQLSLFSGASIAGDATPSEADLQIASNRESLVKIYLAATLRASPPSASPWRGRGGPSGPAADNVVGKISTVENFIAAYNNEAFPPSGPGSAPEGLMPRREALPGRRHIFSVLGKVSRSTLYGWVRDYREGGFDALIPLYKVRRPKVSRAEDRCLRELLLDHVKVGQAIFIVKYFLKRRKTESPSSPATLRRWAKRLLDKK
jgi:hypothetical protein